MADSQTPTRRGYLSGSTLKLIAVITMLIDHIGAFILSDLPAGEIVLIATGDFTFTVYNAFRLVGRTAFPIYCFLIAEGAVHTRNRIRYGCNLLIFACISEIPWNLIHADSLLYERQNVFFTLLFGYLCICVYDLLSDMPLPCAAAMLLVLLSGQQLQADYGIVGIAVVFLFWLLREKPVALGVTGVCILSAKWKAIPACILIGLYNGERGFIRGNTAKYLFYAFYPVHLLILWYIRFRILQ